jgi:hypothetical protein
LEEQLIPDFHNIFTTTAPQRLKLSRDFFGGILGLVRPSGGHGVSPSGSDDFLFFF